MLDEVLVADDGVVADVDAEAGDDLEEVAKAVEGAGEEVLPLGGFEGKERHWNRSESRYLRRSNPNW